MSVRKRVSECVCVPVDLCYFVNSFVNVREPSIMYEFEGISVNLYVLSFMKYVLPYMYDLLDRSYHRQKLERLKP